MLVQVGPAVRHLCAEALAERTMTGKRAAVLRQQADALAAAAGEPGGGRPATAEQAAAQRRIAVLRREAQTLLSSAVAEVLADVQVRRHLPVGAHACMHHARAYQPPTPRRQQYIG